VLEVSLLKKVEVIFKKASTGRSQWLWRREVKTKQEKIHHRDVWCVL